MGEMIITFIFILILLGLFALPSFLKRSFEEYQIEKDEERRDIVAKDLELASFTYDNVNIKGEGEDFDTVGESNYVRSLKIIVDRLNSHFDNKRWVVAELVRDPENEYDKNAVKVMIGGLQVSHIPKKHSKRISEALLLWEKREVPAKCRANIVGGTPKYPNYGVVLDLPRRFPKPSLPEDATKT